MGVHLTLEFQFSLILLDITSTDINYTRYGRTNTQVDGGLCLFTGR